MLYTIIPIEDVFATPSWASAQPGSASMLAQAPQVPAVVGGVQVLALPSYDGRYRVDRVISTDPMDYLKPWLAPGALL